MIPTYILESGSLDCISLVLSPAVKENFMCFSDDENVKLLFNDEKRIITGVALMADTPIYRNNTQFGEHYVVFSKDLIEKLVIDFFRREHNEDVKIDHNREVDDICIFESYIVNDRIKSNLFDVPEGSWIVSYKVDNSEVFERIKQGSLKGFSIEGMFQYPEDKDPLDEIIKNLL